MLCPGPRFAAAPLWCPIQKRAASLAGSTDTWLHGAPPHLFGDIDLERLLDFLLEGERVPIRKPAPAARRGSPSTSREGSVSSGLGLGLAFNVLASGSPQHSATSGCSLQPAGTAVLQRFLGLGGGIQTTVMPTERPLPSSLPSSLQNGAPSGQADDFDEHRLPRVAENRTSARAQRAVHSKLSRSRRPLKRCRSKSSRRRQSPRSDRWPAALTSKLPLLLQISHLREVGKD